MIDPFNQWIVVPDDRPTLPSVDDEVNGLKNITSLSNPSDLYTDEQYLGRNRGLLLDQGIFSSEYEDPDTFEPIAEPNLSRDICPWQILAPRDVDCSMRHYSFSNMLSPPALSPDSSPASAASSTPWLRTPENDMSLAEINSFSPEHMFNYGNPEIGGGELCSSLSLLDQCGHSLEDMPTQVQEFMQEDFACTSRMPSEPRRYSGVSLPPIHVAPLMPTPFRPSTSMTRSATQYQTPSTPSSMLPSPFLVVTSPQTCRTTSLPHTTPHPSQYLLSSSPMMHPASSASSPQLRLSPLSPLTILSRSPSPSPLSPPPICLPSPSPALSCISLSEIEYRNEDIVEADTGTPYYNTASPIIEQPTMPSAKQLGKRRRLDSLDAPPPKISKRSKVAKVDEEEYHPSTSRPKRVNATSRSKPSPHPRAGPSRQGGSPGGGSCTKNSRSEESPNNNATYCKMCKKSFTRPSDYERHIRTSRKHSKKLWPCRYCGRVLARADAQSRHINSIHPGLPDPKDPPVEGDGLIPEPEDD